MNKEELEKEAQRSFDELDDWCVGDDWSIEESYKNGYSNGAEPRENRIATLEEKISVLLSCKNCPENKGGFICVKEYENKCLAQKIQYIKELKEENKVLAQNLEDTEILNKTYEKRFSKLEKENAELKSDNTEWEKASDKWKSVYELTNNQLTKAKEIIEKMLYVSCNSDVLVQYPNCSKVLQSRVEAIKLLKR